MHPIGPGPGFGGRSDLIRGRPLEPVYFSGPIDHVRSGGSDDQVRAGVVVAAAPALADQAQSVEAVLEVVAQIAKQ